MTNSNIENGSSNKRILHRSASSNMERGGGGGSGEGSSFDDVDMGSNDQKMTSSSATISTESSSSFSPSSSPSPKNNNSNNNNGSSFMKNWWSFLMSPTISLPLLNFIDMLSVSLVVPLLFQYYKAAGVTSANQRELLSSVYSSSQILGGILIGAMTDAKLIQRRTVLYLSFGGSALAYAMIAYGNFSTLIFSRVLVGLVKQTMTVTTSLMTKFTTEANRAKYMGRLESSTTAAWIFGPSIGALLYQYVDKKAPVLLASLLFVFNLMLAATLLSDDTINVCTHEKNPSSSSSSSSSKTTTTTINKQNKKNDFWTNLKACTSSKSLAVVIASILIFSWVDRATSYANMGSYYEDAYGLQPHHRGYIQSYQRILGFIVQSSFIGPILSYIGGERRAVSIACALLAVATFWEMQQSISIFLVALAPTISISTTLASVSLRSLLTTVAPEESIFSVFAALDVLQNAAAVTVPFYRAALFQLLGGGGGGGSSKEKSQAAMEGDPDPISWVFSSGVHWVIAASVITFLLAPNRRDFSKEHHKRSASAKDL